MMRFLTALFLAPSALFASSAITVTGQMTITGQFQAISGSFSAPAKATNLSPSNNATHVPLAGPISWSNGGGANTFKLYLDQNNPPTTLVQNSAATSYTPSLSYNTSYNYRVDSVNSAGTTSGDQTAFTTLGTYNADIFIDCENSTAGTALTPTILNAMTHGSLTWSIVGGGGTVSTDQMPPYTPLVVGGTTYTDLSGTRGMSFDVTTVGNNVHGAFASAQSTVYFAANVRIPSNAISGGGQVMDLFVLRHNGATNADFVFQTTSTANQIDTHSVLPSGSITSTQKLTYTPDAQYVIWGSAIAGGTYTCNIALLSNPTNVLQTFTLDCSTASSGQFTSIDPGREDTHGGNNPASGTVGFDGIRLSFSGTVGP